MIRVAIVADTLNRARSLADLLAEDERLDIVDVRAMPSRVERIDTGIADVLLAAGLPGYQVPRAGPPVLVVTDAPVEPGEFGRAVRAWLPAGASAAELAAALFAVAQDLVVLTSDQSRRWLPAPAAEDDHLTVETLTPRELQVLRMLADGLGNKEIAGQLRISDHTAKFHVAQILAKLGANSRAEAVALGIRRGLVPI